MWDAVFALKAAKNKHVVTATSRRSWIEKDVGEQIRIILSAIRQEYRTDQKKEHGESLSYFRLGRCPKGKLNQQG